MPNHSIELQARLDHLYRQVRTLVQDEDEEDRTYLLLWFQVAINNVIEQSREEASIL